MRRGLGLLLLLGGSGVLLKDTLGKENRWSPGVAALMVMIGSGLLLGSGEEDHP